MMVAVTDKMHSLRMDLQNRIDENMEETKGYVCSDSYIPLAIGGIPSSSCASLSSDNKSLNAIKYAIDREVQREERRLNKIANEAKKILNSPKSQTFDTQSIVSRASNLSKPALTSTSQLSSSSKMSQRVNTIK